jgi:multiple sugar transport system permease protein
MKRKTHSQSFPAFVMLSPVFLLFVIFVVLPMILALVIAFKDIRIGAGVLDSPWIGMNNFKELYKDPFYAKRITTAFYNTILFTICFVPVNLLISLGVASLIHSVGTKMQSFYRAAFYLPVVSSAVIFAMIWKWLYDSNFGLLNYVLESLGFDGINWTGDPSWAIWAVIIAAIGAGPGGNVLIFLAALGSVPDDTLEAAKVDGANGLLRWWHVMVPAIKPVILYLLVLNTIGSFQVFELVFILTSGGPAGSSTVLVYEIYNLAFVQGQYGLAGALSLVLMFLVIALTIVQFKVFGKDNTAARKPGVIERFLEGCSEFVSSCFLFLGDCWERMSKVLKSIRWNRNRKPSLHYTKPYSSKTGIIKKLPLHLILFPLALLFLAPMIWMFLSAFTPRIYLQSSPPQISLQNFSLENYRLLFKSAPNLLRWFWNSIYLSLTIMVVQVLLSCLAGYVFARLKFPGRKLFFAILISSLILPAQALIIPLFIVISSGIRNLLHVDILNTHWAIILPALCSPVGIFLMKQYIESMPKELEEAARIDGCGEFGIWWRVILPLCRPIIGAWGILSFTGVWKSFFWPFVVLGSDQLFTLEVGLQTLQQQNTADYGLIMAGATTSALPMIILFFIFQKQIVRGLTFGAVKG